jgi:hypothetical protein
VRIRNTGEMHLTAVFRYSFIRLLALSGTLFVMASAVFRIISIVSAVSVFIVAVTVPIKQIFKYPRNYEVKINKKS